MPTRIGRPASARACNWRWSDIERLVRLRWAGLVRVQNTHRRAVQPGLDILDHLTVEGAIGLNRDVAGVRRHDQVFQFPERMVDRQRFFVKNIDGGAGDPALGQCLDQRVLIDDRPREVLTIRADGFIDLSSAAPTRPRLRALSST